MLDEIAEIKTEFKHNENGVIKITNIEPKQKRAFKGIWIPKEIWLDKDLSLLEKCLLAEIDSLDDKQGCFASNSYFSTFFDVKEQNISKHISKLKKLGYIKQISFDGRKRILKVIDLTQSLRQPYSNDEGSLNDSTSQYNKDYNKDYILSKDNKNSSNELLKNEFKKQNKSSKIKNVLSYKDSKNITKYCLDLFYKKLIVLFPKTRKNSFYLENKIYECEKLINYFIYGFNKSNFNDLRLFIENDKALSNNFSMNEGFNKQEDEFKKYFNLSLNIYDINFNPVNKEILPRHLLDFLYCSFKQFKSYFLYYAFNSVKLIETIKEKKDKYPEYTKLYQKLFYKNKELDLEQKNKLIVCVSNIISEYSNINKKIKYKDKIYYRKDIDNNFRTFAGSLNKFITILHIDFLRTIDDLHEGWLFTNNKCWSIFIDHVKKEFNVDLYESEKSIIRKNFI